VPSFEDLHIQPPIATTLDRWGWSPDDPLAREAAPTVARGHSLVAVTPPVPAYAAPAVAGILSRLGQGRRALLLVPPAQLDQWGMLVHGLIRETRLRVQVARGTARVLRRLRADSLDVVVATPETVLTLVTRSALRMETVDSLMLAWPELLLDEDSITPLMQDLPRDAPRVVYTAEPERVAALVERYARKALTIRPPEPEGALGPVRTVSASWTGRIAALADLVELLDPASLTVWTVDRQYHDAIARAIAGNQPEVQLVCGDAPPAGTIIAFDLPTGERLRQLLAAGEVVLLMPPGTENYLARIAAPRRPVQLPGLLDAVRSADSAQRSAIVKAIETGHHTPSLLTLAPLFERHDPASIAAALFELWTGSAQAVPPPPPEIPGTAKVYVGVGKKDGATANDLVAVLTKELRVDRTKIGRIELRDSYSLIELPAQEAEQVATSLNGVTIRRKRVAARVDRGPSRPLRSDGQPPGRPPRRADRR
jgi:ATP-dependent RNA helicase DeaD